MLPSTLKHDYKSPIQRKPKARSVSALANGMMETTDEARARIPLACEICRKRKRKVTDWKEFLYPLVMKRILKSRETWLIKCRKLV
jgi:hypothetical protein